MKIEKKIRIMWVSILLVTIGFLLWKFVAPFGKIDYSSDFSKYNYFISELTPKDRLVEGDSQVNNVIQAEPVYFYLKTLRPFDTAKVTLHYSNPASLMELGICRDKAQWNFERQPIYFEKLEELATADQTLKENGLLLWQKEKKYGSINDFINNPPSIEKIGVYNYNLPLAFTLNNYNVLPVSQNFLLGAKGSYSLVTYSKGEPINLTFVVRKKNKERTDSKISVSAYNFEGRIIQTDTIDWQTSSMTSDLEYKEFNFNLEAVSSGAYRIEFKTDNEVETEGIITKQSVLSVVGNLQLSDFSRSNFSIFTDATNITFQTINPKNVQKIKVNEQDVDLRETYKQFSLKLEDQTRNIKEIKLEKDDVQLAGNGVFALTSTEIINPFPRQFTNTINLEASGLEYVLAKYEPVGQNSTGKRTILFELNQTCLDKDRYPFLISLPDIENQKPVEIRNIEISLEGKNIIQILERLWNRL